MISILSILCSIFSCKKSSSPYIIEPMFTDLRNLAFSINPSDLGIKQKEPNQVYAMIMETGYDKAVVSLRCFADGSISLLFSNGGGTIGIGEHKEARATGLKFIRESGKYLGKATKTSNYKLPSLGQTIFYFITYSGVYSFESTEDDLGNNKSELSNLFFNAQEVITEARKLDEKK